MLRHRRWVVQDAQYVRSQRTYFCKPLTHTPQYYRRILDLVRPEDRAVAGNHDRRLFITRSPRRLRVLYRDGLASSDWRSGLVQFLTAKRVEASIPSGIPWRRRL